MKCHYPNCTYEGTQAEVDEHLSTIGTDPDHDWPEGYDQPIPPARAEMLRRLDAAYARGDAVKADVRSLLADVRRPSAWPIDARGCVEGGAHLRATRHTRDECPAEWYDPSPRSYGCDCGQDFATALEYVIHVREAHLIKVADSTFDYLAPKDK